LFGAVVTTGVSTSSEETVSTGAGMVDARRLSEVEVELSGVQNVTALSIVTVV
jgi:hypothetical protein